MRKVGVFWGTPAKQEELSSGEYLYGFRKKDKLKPVITFILYSGIEPWDGPTSLHEMLDFSEVPNSLRGMTPNYGINVIEIRKLEHTEVFQTDVRQVFDFIRCSEDKQRLKKLVESDVYYQSMDEEAFDVVVMYTNATELVHAKDYRGKDGKVDAKLAAEDEVARKRFYREYGMID